MPGLSVLGDTTTDKATERQRQQHPDLRWVLWTNGHPGQTSGSHGLHDQTTRLLLTSVASIEGFLQPTSSLKLSGVKPPLDCLQVPLGFWMEMWPCWTLPRARWTQPLGPSAQS